MPLTLHENLDADVSVSSNQQTAAQKKNVSSSDGPTNNNADRKYRHKQRSDRTTSAEMPGAVMVQGNAGTTGRTTLVRTFSNESDNVAELSMNGRAPSLLVAAQVVDIDDDEEAIDLEDNVVLERKIQEEVESQILRNQNNAVVAEPMVDSSKTTNATTEQADRKWFGLIRQNICCYLIVLVGLVVVVALVAGLLTKKQGTCTCVFGKNLRI